MGLENIKATAHPSGNRIDLRWDNPEQVKVLVRRREDNYPASWTDGEYVAEDKGLNFVADKGPEGKGLKAETIYYYTLFPYKGDPLVYHFDPDNRVAAMATGPYDMAGQMYALLPGIYHRYDTVLPKAPPTGMSEEDKQKGQLRRFLDLPGSQLDQLYSLARAMLNLYNLDKTDGRLLDLLGQWIGWQMDYRKEITEQRKEIRNAPYLYKTTGIIPNIEATIKRLIGWESRTKEFAHNVFVSNSPERLNIWICHRESSNDGSSAGVWVRPEKPLLSLNFAYEGRPTAAKKDGEGPLWLFYHTAKERYDPAKKKRKNTWAIWYKTYEYNEQDQVWTWTPSQPLTKRLAFDRHPTAVVQAETLWVFWDTYDEKDRRWRINYRKRTNGEWDPVENFGFYGTATGWVLLHSWSEQYRDHRTVDFTKTPIDTKYRTWQIERQRRMPWAAVDNDGGLWLFWLEKIKGEAKWQLKYNRHNGTRWALDPDAPFPLDEGEDPRVESDLFVLFYLEKIWVLWARKEYPGGPWEIAYRVKESKDPKVSDWSEIYILFKSEAEPGYHDREPAAFVNDKNEIEIFWSSTQDGSWSIWHGILEDREISRENARRITDNLYSHRDPLPLPAHEESSNGGDTWLIYRSNESLVYASEVYRATRTIDSRYAGSTTVDIHNLAKTATMRQFKDFQTYTYDTGKNGQRSAEGWYGRGTLGIYLSSRTEDPREIAQSQQLVENALKQFLPVNTRPVFIIEPSAVSNEPIYTMERQIGEEYSNTITIETTEEYSGLGEGNREDIASNWVWILAWSREQGNDPELQHKTVNFTESPIDITHRTWHIGLTAGG